MTTTTVTTSRKNRRNHAPATWRPRIYSASGTPVEFALLRPVDGSIPRLRIRWEEKNEDGDIVQRSTVFGNFRRYGWGTGAGWDMSGFSGDVYANGSSLGVMGVGFTAEDAVKMHFARAVARLDIPQDVLAEDECQKALGFLLKDALAYIADPATNDEVRARQHAESGTRENGYCNAQRPKASYVLVTEDTNG